MNYRLVSRLLSLVAMLIAGTMVFSLPWALPVLGHTAGGQFETAGFVGLVASIAISLVVALVLRYLGRGETGKIFRKEAMAVVGLSWVLATFLGAMPFLISGTKRAPDVRMNFCDAIFRVAVRI